MLQALRQRREDDEQGFTLIELMVVVLIIAILLAIAIPTFLGAQNRAKDRATQSDLRNALTGAKTLATDQEGYFRKPVTPATSPATFTALQAADLKLAESSLEFVDGHGNASEVNIGVTVSTTPFEQLLVVKQSKAKDKLFWGIWADKDGDVKYCKAAAASSISLTNCSADSFSAATAITPPAPAP